MRLDRRTFLQQSGLALLTWGLTEAGISSLEKNSRIANLVKNYRQTLATPTSRKLALLVGINRYPHNQNLAGCLTDIELQRDLLINRFGFNPRDIVTLSDRQATRENIETAFIEHLGKQAKPDDVVLFHFSGYGRQVKMPLNSSALVTNETADNPDAFKLVKSFVPVDGILPAKKNTIANNILQDTLLALAQSLSTSKCTFVLDTCFSTTPRSKHSSFKIRSAKEAAETLSSQELVFIEQLRSNFAAKGLKPAKRLLSFPGVVLSASSNNQIAAERKWNSFSAGLFTYALTQHLWQITPSTKIQIALGRAAASVEQVMGRQQQPTLNNLDKSTIGYYFATSETPKATGIISQINGGGNVEVKLLGLPPTVLDCYGTHSCLNFISANNVLDSPLIQIQSKDSLIAKAKILNSSTTNAFHSGQLVIESIRMLERNLGLTLALDGDMQRIERVDATSALANTSGVNSAVVSGEQNADCLLGKVNYSNAEINPDSNSSVENKSFSYGLYTAGGVLIGKTTGVEEEAVKIAVERLQPQFKNLLAAKWLELTNNEFTSRLKVTANLKVGQSSQSTHISRSTLPEVPQLANKKSVFVSNKYVSDSQNVVPLLSKGENLELSLQNTGEQKLYAMIFSIDSDSNIFVLSTSNKPQSAETSVQLEDIEIGAQGELTIPDVENSWKWKVGDSLGINAIYIVLTVQPFSKTRQTLTDQQNFKPDQQQILNLVNPVAVMVSLMEDLHNASSVDSALLPNQDVYALDVDSWATLNLVYEIANG